MISNLELKNFKAFKYLNLKLENLNIFTGLNGMGKSTVIQSLLLLRQSYEKGLIQRGNLSLKGSLINLGTGKDILYQYSEEDFIEFNLSFKEFNNLSMKFKYSSYSDVLDFYKTEIFDLKNFNLFELENINLFNKNFQYLNAEHIGQKESYPISRNIVVDNDNLGIYGEYSTYYLYVNGNTKINFENLIHPNSKSEILLRQVDAWLGEISPGIKLNTRLISGSEQVLLDYRFETQGDYTNEYRPVNVGFGITYSLPTILSLLAVKKDKLVILENPESHVHPKGQSSIGKLLSLVSNNDVQVIVETHSDHILNGVRVAVKEGLIDHNKVKIFYFNRDFNTKENKSIVKEIKLDKNGELNSYPDGFLDEWNNQLLKLL